MVTLSVKLRILEKPGPGRLFNGLDLFCGHFVEFWRPGTDYNLILEVPPRRSR